MRRRTLLKGALASIPFAFMWRPRAARATGSGYGDLVDDPNNIFDLPPGFTYRVISRKGDLMSDGYHTPGHFDGMGCFPGAAGTGTIVLMRNHELGNESGDSALGPVASGQSQPVQRYDSAMFGCVTRVVLDAETLAVRSSNLVVYGTSMNCSGGKSPWGWLTCEEAVSTNHGYVFACATTAESVQPAVRVDAYGRFQHEAAAVDPHSNVVYLTEDQGDSCFYRFVPDSVATPWQGKLQALRIVGHDAMNTGVGHSIDDAWEIAWVDIANPTPAYDTLRHTAQADGAAIFMRGEGCAMHDGVVYFTATTGGPLGTGQVFRLDPYGDGGTLTLLAQSEDTNVIDMADNVTVAPWGELFTAEDGTGEQCIRVIAQDGTVSKFGRNALSGGELTGICFSPDGRVLFVNIFGAGVTLAITGPFPEMADPPPPPPHGRGDEPMPQQIGGTDGANGEGSDGDGGDITVGGCSASDGGSSGIGAAAVVGTLGHLALRRA